MNMLGVSKKTTTTLCSIEYGSMFFLFYPKSCTGTIVALSYMLEEVRHS